MTTNISLIHQCMITMFICNYIKEYIITNKHFRYTQNTSLIIQDDV